jgi:hypothetical protein
MGPSGKCIWEFHRTSRWLPSNAELHPEDADHLIDPETAVRLAMARQ